MDGSPIHAGHGGHGDGEDAYGGREGAAVPAEGYLDLDRGASSAAGGRAVKSLRSWGMMVVVVVVVFCFASVGAW